MNHIVLLGDSIFDNKAYVGEDPDVIAQLRQKLPAGTQATLLAVDGSMTMNVARQLERLPADATHLVVSIGGNDALNAADILNRPARSTADSLHQLAMVAEQFADNYQAMLRAVGQCNLPTALCTIYYPRMPESEVQRLAVTALTVFNDVIIRVAFAAGLPLIDLRLVCNEDSDYANPIEPSVHGGNKITSVILQLLTEHDFRRQRAEVFI